MAKPSKRAAEAMDKLRWQADEQAERIRTVSTAVADALAKAKANPIWDLDLEALRTLAESHAKGTSHTGWTNPYPKSDPRSLYLEYQFKLHHDRSRFKMSLQSRQSGKDFTTQGEAAEDCMARPGTQWMTAAPSERQSLTSLEQGKTWAEAFELVVEDYDIQREGGSETLLKSAMIRYSNGSKAWAVPGRPNTVRGESANLILTEFDFFDDPAGTWRGVLPSITNPMRGGEKKVRLITTPNGKGGATDKIWSKPTVGKFEWSKHLVTIYHAVLMGLPVDIELLREMFDDPDGWAQEFECQFLDATNVLLPYELIGTCESGEASEAWSFSDGFGGGPIYMGIDFGRQNDPTVAWTLQQVGGLLVTREVLVLHQVSSPDQEQILKDRIRAATSVSYDYTGPGIGLGDWLVKTHGEWKPEEHKLGKVELCTFTAPFKRLIFPRLRRVFEQRGILIPISREIREDLHEMQQTRTGDQFNYWSKRTKLGHSDRCTAAALAVRASERGARVLLPGRLRGAAGRTTWAQRARRERRVA